MNRHPRLTFLLAGFLLTGVLGWKTWTSVSAAEQPNESYDSVLLFARVVQLIRQDYVDGSKVSYKDLTYAALRGMLSSLDPHSQFLDRQDFQDMQRETSGEFSGLGIIVGAKSGSVVILSPMEDSPASRAGLMPGDRILKVGDRTTEKLSLAEVMKALKGSVGQTTRLTLLRPVAGAANGGTIFVVELTRETIQVSSVKEARMLPASLSGQAKIGYVRIEEFSDNTSDELDSALADLDRQGMQALVIDLRNNPGGLLDSAVDVAGKFLPPNVVIVSTKGRTPDQTQEFRARPEREQPPYPIAVLINGYSASGAEIVAGALKDLKRAVLVGETTFGKGSVQTVMPLGDGVGMRLTTAKYYTPSKRTIHEIGITPDIAIPITDAEERRIVVAQMEHTPPADEQGGSAKFEDRQLDRAVGALRSIRIYDARQISLNAVPKQTDPAHAALSKPADGSPVPGAAR